MNPTCPTSSRAHEQAIPDRDEHAEIPKHLNDDALAQCAEQERAEAGADDHDADGV